MVVTPFGDMSLDDPVSIERFIDAHARRHRTYVPYLHISGGTLRGKIDADWMLRHALRHISLATYTKIALSSADTKALLLPGKWRTEQELHDWSELHNRIHLKIDRQLKIH
jgi:hypothetical protein